MQFITSIEIHDKFEFYAFNDETARVLAISPAGDKNLFKTIKDAIDIGELYRETFPTLQITICQVNQLSLCSSSHKFLQLQVGETDCTKSWKIEKTQYGQIHG